MSLLAASKITSNPTVRARVEAAIRKTAAEKGDAAGAEGVLAKAALVAPETVSAPFLQRVATNADVAANACAGCGHSEAEDSALEWIVSEAWAAVAAELHPGGWEKA